MVRQHKLTVSPRRRIRQESSSTNSSSSSSQIVNITFPWAHKFDLSLPHFQSSWAPYLSILPRMMYAAAHTWILIVHRAVLLLVQNSVSGLPYRHLLQSWINGEARTTTGLMAIDMDEKCHSTSQSKFNLSCTWKITPRKNSVLHGVANPRLLQFVRPYARQWKKWKQSHLHHDQ